MLYGSRDNNCNSPDPNPIGRLLAVFPAPIAVSIAASMIQVGIWIRAGS